MDLLTPEYVYRRYETDGVPDSGKHNPDKSEIIQLLKLIVPPLTPFNFGAKGDGASDDTSALQEFFNNAAKFGSLPNNIFRTTSVIDVPSGFTLVSFGGAIHSATPNITRLRILDKDKVNFLGALKITGPGKANGSGRGLVVGGANGCKIEGVHCEDIDGIGIYASGGAYDAPRGDKTQFSLCSAKNCWTGYEDAPNSDGGNLRNEYATHVGFHATGCQRAVWTTVGNTSFVGGKLVDNVDGFSGAAGLNSTHGTVTGMQINHNSQYNVNLESQTAGLLFSGCTIFGDSQTAGVIRVVNSRGIVFSGCLVEASIYCDGAASNVMVNGGYNNNNFVPLRAGLNPERIFVFNMMDQNHRADWSDEGWDYVNVYRGTSDQSLSSGTNTRVVFNSLQRKNIKLSYDLATGVFTAKTKGFYRVTANLKIGASGTPTGFATIKKNGADLVYAPLGAASGFGVCTIAHDVDCNAGDTIEIWVNATGTSPVVGITTSRLQIQGL